MLQKKILKSLLNKLNNMREVPTLIPEGDKKERPYDPQAYFEEVIKEEGSRDAKMGTVLSSDLGENMLRVLRERDEKKPETIDRLIQDIGITDEKTTGSMKKSLQGKEQVHHLIRSKKVLTSMALDGKGNIIDPEMAKAYIDDKKQEIDKKMENLRHQIEEIERKTRVSQAELGQWNKLLELAAAELNNDTKAQKVAAEKVIKKLNELKNGAKENAERDGQSREKAKGYRETIDLLIGDIDRLEKIKTKIPSTQ
jgi:soluble cytochrome b562